MRPSERLNTGFQPCTFPLCSTSKTHFMIKIKKISLTLLTSVCFSFGYSQTDELYQTVVKLDSAFFGAYNTCNMEKQADFYSDSIEFYHDKGGLTTSKQEILDATRKNICGKVTRELVKGSIEVSPVPGYGAVEIGMHMFHNNQEKGQIPHPSRFVIIWRNREGKWTITRVISLHN